MFVDFNSNSDILVNYGSQYDTKPAFLCTFEKRLQKNILFEKKVLSLS